MVRQSFDRSTMRGFVGRRPAFATRSLLIAGIAFAAVGGCPQGSNPSSLLENVAGISDSGGGGASDSDSTDSSAGGEVFADEGDAAGSDDGGAAAANRRRAFRN